VTAKVGVYGETDANVEDGGVAILELESGGIVTVLGGELSIYPAVPGCCLAPPVRCV
jgi:hypothetical protein